VDLTVVIPTRNEAPNVPEMLRRLDGALRDLDAEVLFVDDSDDDTPAVISAAAQAAPRPVRLLHRAPENRAGGLGGAVIAGMRTAAAPWVVVLDGDLQHPPELVPALVATGRATSADLVYGTRYSGRGTAYGLDGALRSLVSTLCTVLAKLVFPRRLRGISDPMSGFFAVRVDAVALPALRPAGYKILVEIIARSALSTVTAVPYAFRPRFAGRSKASLREGLLFLRHLLVLRTTVGRLGQLAGFLTVGLSGVVVNTIVLSLLTATAVGLPYLLASVIATHVAILWNFLLLERFVFRGTPGRTFLSTFPRFWCVNAALLPVQLGLLALAVEVGHIAPVPANVVVLALVFLVRYLATLGWVFGRRGVPVSAVVAASATGLGAAEPGTAAARAVGPKAQHRGVRRYLVRLALPLLVTMAAFPVVVGHLVRAAASLPVAATTSAVLLSAAALVATRSSPNPQEPDVHDRQLDVILAVPLLAGAVWLNVGWADPASPAEVPARVLAALVLFLAGAALLLLGTRMTARLRWILCLPLLGVPWLGAHPTLRTLLVVAVACAAVVTADRHRRRSPAPGRSQKLPRLQGGAVGLGLLALTLGSVAMTKVPL
jgi:putative flippase GtrA